MATLLAAPLALRPPDPVWDRQIELQAMRVQAAVVRSLLDEIDMATPPIGRDRFAEAFAAQAVEELAHLACKMIRVATATPPQAAEPDPRGSFAEAASSWPTTGSSMRSSMPLE